MIVSTMKKTEEIQKTLKEQGDKSKNRLKKEQSTAKLLLKMLGRRPENGDDTSQASDPTPLMFDKQGQKNSAFP